MSSASASREDDGDDDPLVASNNDKKRSYLATARMFKLRRNLDQLDCFHQQKEHDVLKARSGSGKYHTSRATVAPYPRQQSMCSTETFNGNFLPNDSAVCRKSFQLRREHCCMYIYTGTR